MIRAFPIRTMSIPTVGQAKVQIVSIFVIKAPVRSSIFPEGSDWMTMSPFSARKIGVQHAPSGVLTKIGVLKWKQAVLFLDC